MIGNILIFVTCGLGAAFAIDLLTYPGHLIIPTLIKIKRKRETTPETIKEMDEFQKEYLKISNDIKYVEGKFDSYITTSLINDFEMFKEETGKDLHSIYNSQNYQNRTRYWTIREFSPDNFELIKYGEGHRDRILIYVKYDFFTGDGTLKIHHVRISGISNVVETKQLHEIISKYILFIKLEEKKRDNRNIQKELNNIIKIVGKETIRDQRIDDILNQI